MIIFYFNFWYIAGLISVLCTSLYFLRHINKQYKALAQKKGIPSYVKKLFDFYYVILIFIYVHAFFSQICKFIVKLALKYKYGKKFKGFLKGQDPFYIDKRAQQAIVPVLLLINFEGDPQEFYSSTKQHMNNCLYQLTKCNKFFGTIESWNGYYYIRNDSKEIREYITKLRLVPEKEVINRVDLLKLVGEYYEQDLPKFNKALWQVLIGKQPVMWSTSQKYKLYPILFKFSHCLFDETNFMETLLGIFSDKKRLKHLSPIPPKSTCFAKFRMIFEFLKYSYSSIPLAIVNSDLLKHNRNVLVGAELGTKKMFCVGRNDTKSMLDKVKQIKAKVTFTTCSSCIFETAIIASLSEFYQMYSYSADEKNLVYVTTIVDNFGRSIDLESDFLTFKKSGTCRNDVKFMCLNSSILKLVDLEKPEMIISTLQHISSLKIFVQNFGEPEITRKVSSGVYNYFPDYVQGIILSHQISPVTIVSNFIGPSSEISINGRVVKDIYGWCPNFEKTGITFAICSYGDVPHITLNADANLIGSNADAQALLDGVYKYIDILNDYFS